MEFENPLIRGKDKRIGIDTHLTILLEELARKLIIIIIGNYSF